MNHKNQNSDTYPLFDTFWNNTGLRGNVFENKLDTQKEAAKDEFDGLVTDVNSLIYQFIALNEKDINRKGYTELFCF